MSSLADGRDLVGFFSYSREDDEGSGGRLSKLRERIQEELRGQLGRTKRDFRLWQDKVAIAHGELWEDTIKKGISESAFFIPIITPTAVKSRFCKFDFETFLAREKELGRSNLVFPILYIPVPALADDGWRQDPLLEIIGSRQYEQWQNLRHLDPSSTEVALRVEKFCENICKALLQPWLSPQERQEAEARQRTEEERRREEKLQEEARQKAEEERRRQEAEAKRRAKKEAETQARAEARRRTQEERKRQQAETKLSAERKAAEERKQAEAGRQADDEREKERLSEGRYSWQRAELAQRLQEAEASRRAEDERRLQEVEASRHAEDTKGRDSDAKPTDIVSESPLPWSLFILKVVFLWLALSFVLGLVMIALGFRPLFELSEFQSGCAIIFLLVLGWQLIRRLTKPPRGKK
jgi:TIR domain